MAAQNQQPSGSRSQEFTVVANHDPNKRVTIMQFPTEQGFDKTGFVTMSRENNMREYKSAYNIDTKPTFGAGSVFGQEAKEEARRKKFGYIRKNYNPEAQPWVMQIGAEKNAKKFKGTRNGGILENASYFIFTKRKDGLFEAVPVEEWHSFKPTISYNNLNAEEAEEEFAKRDKTMNLFNIMVRKRIKKEGEEEEPDTKKGVKSGGKSKGLMLTEMEDWADLSDEDGNPDGGNASDSSINGTKVKGKGKGKARKKKKDKDTDDEAVEDSDDGDAEAKQVDYMSDTSDSDSDMEGRADKSKYEEKGVEDETGLRDIVVESDDEKEEEKKDDKKKKKEKAGSDESSSSSESESDDPDRKDDEFTKAFLMTGSKKDRGKSPVPRSATPTNSEGGKRKQTSSPRSGSPAIKKVKSEPDFKPISSGEGRPTTPVASGSQPSSANPTALSRDGVTEENVRRYLLRKPMSSKDLSKIFKSKKLGLSNEEIVMKLTEIIKRIHPITQKLNGQTYFSLK